ncbi:MAG TPA: hypothetical protein VNO55_21900 [Polyangia bacterium]|nr:hypothetical protein [Polyangia bacterium]
MKTDNDEYSIDCTTQPATALLRGVLRLQSTESYDRLFEPIRNNMLAGGRSYVLDLREVVLMNSSGIRALAGLVLLAKEKGVALSLRVRESIPWQRKTVASLKLLDPALDVQGQ